MAWRRLVEVQRAYRLAVNLFNELGSDPKRRVVAAFHLTC